MIKMAITKQIKSGIEYLADIYRTAPFAETVLFMGAAELALGLYVDMDFLLLGALAIPCGISLTIDQFKLRRKLEKSISELGYMGKDFKKTRHLWCDKQTASVVARRHGCLEEYLALCDKVQERKSA